MPHHEIGQESISPVAYLKDDLNGAGANVSDSVNKGANGPTYPKQNDHRDDLIDRLCGQTVVCPDLGYIYNDWQPPFHPNLDDLRLFLENWIDT